MRSLPNPTAVLVLTPGVVAFGVDSTATAAEPRLPGASAAAGVLAIGLPAARPAATTIAIAPGLIGSSGEHTQASGGNCGHSEDTCAPGDVLGDGATCGLSDGTCPPGDALVDGATEAVCCRGEGGDMGGQDTPTGALS